MPLYFGPILIDNPCWINAQCIPQDLLVNGCATMRSIGAASNWTLSGNAASDSANMIDWVNAYDITTVPWGSLVQGEFTAPSQTTPPSTAGGNCAASGACMPQNFTQCVGSTNTDGFCDIIECLGSINVSRSQFIFLCPIQAYYVIAYGFTTNAADAGTCGGGGNWAARGCIFTFEEGTLFPQIIDLPIPDNTLDETILVTAYTLGIIQSGASLPGGGLLSQEMSVAPNLSSLTTANSGFAGFGANWSASLATPCYGSPDDPFTGSDPP